MTIASGNNGRGPVGTVLPPLAVLVLDATGAPLPGVLVTFAISSGGGFLSTHSSLTDAGGKASTILTLPTTAGSVQVVATTGNFSVSFTATATAVVVSAPAPLANSMVNGTTFNPATPPSPGSLVAIFGQNLAVTTAWANGYPLPVSLEGTSVSVTTPGGPVALPLIYVSPLQINAIIPFELAPGTYPFSVVSNSISSNSVQVSIAPFSPGIFTVNSNGQGQGVLMKTDYSLVTVANPASPGSVVALYAGGLGAVNPPVASGKPGAAVEPLNRTVQTPRVFFDIYEAQVLDSILAPGFAGVYQVNVRIPAQVSPATNVAVSFSIGGIASNHVTIAVGR